MNAITTPIQAKTNTPINMTWEHVSPTRAALWLKNTVNTGYSQRGLDTGAVKRYASQNTRGLWHQHTGDTICITEHEGLEVILDGQHRLNMITLSQAGIDLWVARNVPSDAFKYKDGGKKRTLRDVMKSAGWTDHSLLATTGNFLWLHDVSGYMYAKSDIESSVMEGDKFDWLVDYCPDIRKEWNDARSIISAAHKAIDIPKPTLFFFWLILGQSDADLRDSFFHYIGSPVERDSPSKNFTYMVMKLADLQKQYRLKDIGSVRTEIQRHHYAMAIMLAWNSHRCGKIYRTAKGFNGDFNKLADGDADIASLPFENVADIWQAL